MKKALDTVASVVMLMAVVIAILLVGVRIFGLTPYTVLSGSMEPTYHVGSLIYVKKVSPYELRVDDPITYVIEGGTIVTHRIIEIIPDEDDPTVIRFRTKGDNNNTPDGDPVHSNNIIGKPVFTIPVLGYIAYFVQNPPGSIIAIGLVLTVAVIAFVPDLVDRIFKDDEAGENLKGEDKEG